MRTDDALVRVIVSNVRGRRGKQDPGRKGANRGRVSKETNYGNLKKICCLHRYAPGIKPTTDAGKCFGLLKSASPCPGDLATP